MAFIKFTEHGRSYAARASVSKSGMLSFNDGARRRFEMDKYGYCILYYDPDTRRVGIELTANPEAEGARKIRMRSTGADIAAKSFVDFFELGIAETMLYAVDRDEEKGMLLLDLDKGKRRGIS